MITFLALREQSMPISVTLNDEIMKYIING